MVADGGSMSREVAISFDEMEQRLNNKAKKKEEKLSAGPREIQIIKQASGLYVAAYEGGGQIPEAIRGSWTSKARLESMINRYYLEKGRFVDSVDG